MTSTGLLRWTVWEGGEGVEVREAARETVLEALKPQHKRSKPKANAFFSRAYLHSAFFLSENAEGENSASVSVQVWTARSKQDQTQSSAAKRDSRSLRSPMCIGLSVFRYGYSV